MKKQSDKRFCGLIDQMNRDKHKLVLVRFGIAKEFANECIRRGYEMEVGGTTEDGVIMYRK